MMQKISVMQLNLMVHRAVGYISFATEDIRDQINYMNNKEIK